MSAWLPALAALFAAVVAALVLWPLHGRGRRLPWMGAVLALGIAGTALYTLVGTPQAVEPASAGAGPASLREGIAELEAALQRDPQRADGWALLGRSQVALGNTGKAAEAFSRAVALAPDDAGVLVEAAEARAQADPGKQFDDQALAWLQHAQALAPQAERAAWLLGIAQRQRGQDAQAAATWEALLPRLEPGAARALREQIAVARSKAGLPALPDNGAATNAEMGGGLRIQLSIDPALAERIRAAPQASVFVIARVPGGPPMPVAVEKHPAGRLPQLITLDDADSPMPTSRLSSLQEVEVLARFSVSGNASRQPGDVDSAPVRVRLPRAAPVQLVLGRD